ncbi:MAG: hypothetical protein OXC44_01255 [Proteobacteria bacterium]|nr:hypothetical protein [Pseudomonadota bacterium]
MMLWQQGVQQFLSSFDRFMLGRVVVTVSILSVFFGDVLGSGSALAQEDLSAEDDDTYTQKDPSYRVPQSDSLYDTTQPRDAYMRGTSSFLVDLRGTVGSASVRRVGSRREAGSGGSSGVGRVYSLAGLYNLAITPESRVHVGAEISTTDVGSFYTHSHATFPLRGYGVKLAMDWQLGFSKWRAGLGTFFGLVQDSITKQNLTVKTEGFVARMETVFSFDVSSRFYLQAGGGYGRYKLNRSSSPSGNAGTLDKIASPFIFTMPYAFLAVGVHVWHM